MKITMCLILIAAALASPVSAEPYVSLNGNFYIILPDDWEQIDYNTVDMFMQQRGVSIEGLSYEAVFAAKGNSPFFEGNYLILTIDTVGNLNDDQIDSVLNSLRKVFNEDIQYYPVGDLLANLDSNTPYYDREKRVAVVLNDLTQQEKTFRKNILYYKFYESGVAKFYFYSPDSLMEQSQTLFEEVVASLSTEDIESKLSSDKVEITDVDGSTSGDDEDNEFGLPVAIMVALLIVIITAAKRRKSRKNIS